MSTPQGSRGSVGGCERDALRRAACALANWTTAPRTCADVLDRGCSVLALPEDCCGFGMRISTRNVRARTSRRPCARISVGSESNGTLRCARANVWRHIAKPCSNSCADGFVYPCRCSRKDLQQAIQAPHEDDDEPVYNGRCRPELEQSAAHEFLPDTNYRFRVPDGEVVSFVDGDAGAQSFLAGCGAGADFGDFVVWRKDGLPSYQLACVVDDAEMGVTEVVRGQDLLRSTARQMLLQRALRASDAQILPLRADAR